MKKFQLDLVSILILALLVAAAIMIWGNYVGIKTPETRSFALGTVALGALVLAFIASFDRLSRWSDAVRVLGKWLHLRKPEMAGTTQGSLLATSDRKKSSPKVFGPLRDALRDRHGMFWRYRQPWLLLTGNDGAIKRLLPALAEQGWLVMDDVVLLWRGAVAQGQPDRQWLASLYRLRRRRPVDAVVVVLNGVEDLLLRRRGASDAAGATGMQLARIADALRWSAPVVVVDLAQVDKIGDGHTPVIGCEFTRTADAGAIEAALLALRDQLVGQSVAQLSRDGKDRYAARLSRLLDTRSALLARWIAGLASSRRHQPISGAFFAPFPVAGSAQVSGHEQVSGDAPESGHASDSNETLSAGLPLWSYLGDLARHEPGRRVGWHPVTVFSALVLCMLGVWMGGMLVSGLSNARDLRGAQQALQTLGTAPDAGVRLRALLALQQQIARYEERMQHGAPVSHRFGLNHDAAALAVLWPAYAQASQRELVAPIQQQLEAALTDLGQMRTDTLDAQTSEAAQAGHKTLAAYLMLAEPEHADAAFMTPLLTHYWSTDAALPAGEKLDLSERLLGFYAQHLKAHPPWHITPNAALVNASRQTLLAVIGVKNSQDTIYQGIVDGVGNKYPEQTLVSLTAGADPRGLLSSDSSVPGAFTRQAYEGTIAPAIAEAAKHSDVASDWVLIDSRLSPGASSSGAASEAAPASAEALQAALTERYFADYAAHWQGFMNTLRWEPAPTLPAVIEQLTLLADARQSPVIALMKSLQYQGGAGALQDSLSDSLVAKAQNVLGKKPEAPRRVQPDPAGPLGATFGPVLRLVGQGSADTHAGADSDLSLQRYMERVTRLRLKLQQISDSADADAQARQAAQALFQGKSSELADTQSYAQLIAASVGAQWAGMGEALFVRPVAQATQTVLQPAQASLNEAWQQSIVATWNQSFSGRYPFAATDNDASLAELTRFIRPQDGLIATFLTTQLAGVLERQGDQWVPVASSGNTLAFDPTFLQSVNTLQHLAGHLLVQGEPQYRFEFKPVPTPGITDTVLTLDGQTLHYYNQRETWQALTWPSNDPGSLGTRLQWQADTAGTNKNFEFGGRWGLVRLLERARVEPIDDATYQLTWQGAPDTGGSDTETADGRAVTSVSANATPTAAARGALVAHGPLAPPPQDMRYPLSYVMRTEAGQGPLELLALRGFVLPTRIFAARAPGIGATTDVGMPLAPTKAAVVPTSWPASDPAAALKALHSVKGVIQHAVTSPPLPPLSAHSL